MKGMRKKIILLLAFCILVGSFTLSAMAAENEDTLYVLMKVNASVAEQEEKM